LLIDKDVRRFHVAMHEALRVGRVERVGDLRHDRQRARRLQCALAPEERLEVGALDVAHRDEEPPVGLACLVDRHDIGVVEARRDARLAEHSVSEGLVVR
jgi:hypothetical protein